MPSLPDTILYVRLPNWVGDVCMSLPSLHALLATKLPVVVCARPWARALLADYPLHGFIDMQSGWYHNGKAVRQQLQTEGVTLQHLGLLLPNSLSSALTFHFAGISSLAYRGDGRGLLLRWPVRRPVQPLHTVASWYFLTCQALATWRLPVPPDHAPPRQLGLRLHAQCQAQAQTVLDSHHLTPGGFILIAPTATGLHRGKIKVWPDFDSLTRRLQTAGHTVVMCPPPAEVQAARANVPTALCLPSLDVGTFAALAAMAALVICNDSGVSHLAAAVQAHQLTLIGVTNAAYTGPWSPQAECLGEDGRWPSLTQVLDRAQILLAACAPKTR